MQRKEPRPHRPLRKLSLVMSSGSDEAEEAEEVASGGGLGLRPCRLGRL